MIVDDNPNLQNFWEFKRQFARAIFESLTVEEVEIAYKMIRHFGYIFTDLTLEEYLQLFKLLRSVLKAFTTVNDTAVKDGIKAYNEGWRLMAHYRKTGETD